MSQTELLTLAPRFFLISSMTIPFSLLRPRPWHPLWLLSLSHVPPPIHQQILWAPPSKYIQNSTTSHHPHSYDSDPRHSHLSPGSFNIFLTGFRASALPCSVSCQQNRQNVPMQNESHSLSLFWLTHLTSLLISLIRKAKVLTQTYRFHKIWPLLVSDSITDHSVLSPLRQSSTFLRQSCPTAFLCPLPGCSSLARSSHLWLPTSFRLF